MPTAINIKRTRAFANTAARVADKPDFIGQWGVQIDSGSIWRATALTAGAWSGQFRMDEGLRTAYVELPSQGGTPPSTPSGAVRVYCLSPNQLAVRTTGGDSAIFELNGISADRTYVLPDASGTFALSSTGETFTSINIDGTAGAGFVGLASQSPAPGEPSDGVRLYGTGVGWAFKDISAHVAAFDMADLLTSNRTYTLPDASGTIMLTSALTGTANQITVTGTTLSIASGRGLTQIGSPISGLTADYNGQWLTQADGVFGIGYGGTSYAFGLVDVNRRYLLGDTRVASGYLEVQGRLSAEAVSPSSEHLFTISGSFVDGVAKFLNTSVTGASRGYSAAAFYSPADGSLSGRALAVGFGANVANAYGNAAYLATNPNSSDFTVAPPDLLFSQERSGGTSIPHIRIKLDGTAQTVTLYGWDTNAALGPIGVQVSSTGSVTLAPTTATSAIIGGGATASTLRFLEPSGSGTNYSEFKAQAQSANITYTFPATIPTANDVLTASSVSAPNVTLSWTTPSGGSGTKTKAFFNPLNNQPPAANFATIDTRNSIALLNFDDTTEESAIFVGVMPEGASLGSGLSVFVTCCAATATSGDYRLGAAWMRCNTDIDSDSFDTAIEATTTTSGTSGIPSKTTLTTTNIDGITAGDMYRLKIYRDTSDGGDTMAGDLQLLTVEVQTVA